MLAFRTRGVNEAARAIVGRRMMGVRYLTAPGSNMTFFQRQSLPANTVIR